MTSKFSSPQEQNGFLRPMMPQPLNKISPRLYSPLLGPQLVHAKSQSTKSSILRPVKWFPSDSTRLILSVRTMFLESLTVILSEFLFLMGRIRISSILLSKQKLEAVISSTARWSLSLRSAQTHSHTFYKAPMQPTESLTLAQQIPLPFTPFHNQCQACQNALT